MGQTSTGTGTEINQDNHGTGTTSPGAQLDVTTNIGAATIPGMIVKNTNPTTRGVYAEYNTTAAEAAHQRTEATPAQAAAVRPGSL